MTGMLSAYQRSDLFAGHNLADVTAMIQVEDDDGEIVVFAERDGGRVHHLQSLLQNFHIGDFSEFFGVFDDERIGVVDPIHLGGFENGISLNFHRAERRGGIGGKIGVTSAAGKDHHTLLLKMADSATADERLGDLVHLNRGLHAGVDTLLFEGILKRQPIDDGSEHAHVVGGDAVHVASLLGNATKEIAAADHDGDLNAKRMNVSQFGCNFVDAKRVDAETLLGG